MHGINFVPSILAKVTFEKSNYSRSFLRLDHEAIFEKKH